MDKPEYPEWGRRERMLWAIHEWVQDRPAGEYRIEVDQVATLIDDGEYVQFNDPDPDKAAAKKRQEEQINLFKDLVEEDLIKAKIHTAEETPYFAFAMVRGLSRQGEEMIQELPDPNQSLLDRLDEITVAIRGLQDVPEADKDATEKALEEIKGFVRTSTPAVAVQLLAAFYRSHFGG
jgi:hypothetical protein